MVTAPGEKTFKKRIHALLKLNTSPPEIALGVSIGVMIGIMPLYGFHTILAIIAAVAVPRANKIAILIGTNISLPPTVPFITWAGYSIGRALLGNGYPELTWGAFRGAVWTELFSLYYPLFVGSFILGLMCATLFYFLTVCFIKRKNKKREHNSSVLSTAAEIECIDTVIDITPG